MHDVMLGKRKGSWTPEEDDKLVEYIKLHGPGRWDYLAKCAGLERSGKSCRLRWLNYLRPGLRSDGITLEEQLRIIKLQLEWGNRWSKIAESLPGRTDNEVKNYWRTRVHKRAKDLNYDADSPQFKHILLNDWMPRLAEQIQTTFGNDDDAAESSTILNNIHSATSIKQEGTTHFVDTATSGSSTLENKGRTRLGNHAGSHMIERDDMSGLVPQRQPRLGYGSPCSIMQMETNKLDRGPFGPNHFTPYGSLPPLSLPSSPLSSNDRPSQGSGSSHYLTSDYYDDKFQLDQNDGGLKKAENWSFSRPEFSYDGGILGHEVDDTLANLELLMSNENMTRDLQQLLFDNDDDSYLVTSFCSKDPPALYQ